MNCSRDILGDYKLTSTVSEEDILRAAEEILTRRFLREGTASDPAAAGRIFKMRLAHLEREVFTVMFLDTRHRIIAIEDLFHGTIDGVEVHPRVVAQRGLALNAAAVILAHNHPSGSTDPSAADRAVTAQLKSVLAGLDIRLLDHFVVGGANPPVSLAARGWV